MRIHNVQNHSSAMTSKVAFNGVSSKATGLFAGALLAATGALHTPALKAQSVALSAADAGKYIHHTGKPNLFGAKIMTGKMSGNQFATVGAEYTRAFDDANDSAAVVWAGLTRFKGNNNGISLGLDMERAWKPNSSFFLTAGAEGTFVSTKGVSTPQIPSSYGEISTGGKWRWSTQNDWNFNLDWGIAQRFGGPDSQTAYPKVLFGLKKYWDKAYLGASIGGDPAKWNQNNRFAASAGWNF